MSMRETYQLAHTARCKLQMAADRPDRNLRFILGHAFTLDKLMLRVVEIENSPYVSASSSEEDLAAPTCTNPSRPRRVSFTNAAKPHVPPTARKASPPPHEDALLESDSDSSNEEEEEEEETSEDEEEDEGLGLQRFGSATAKPPRMIEDLEDDDDELDEPRSPTEEELQAITGGPSDEELVDLYHGVKSCPCHGQQEYGPVVKKAWEIPGVEGENRRAVVQVIEVGA